MASIHLEKLMALLLIAILNNVVSAAGNTLMTTEQRHIALCVQTIAHQYFNHGRSTVVSMPTDLRNNSRRPLIQFQYSDDVQLVDLLLQYVHEDTCCPVQMLPAKKQLGTTVEINHSYIIFIWREQGDEDIIDILRTQLNDLQNDDLLQWNPRGRFVVVVTDQESSSLMSEALKIYEMMWMDYKAVNTVVLMPDSSGNYTVLDLYTGFPYQNGNCEKVKEITLLDKCVLENNGTFSKKTNLFPSKIPNNFQKCVVKASIFGWPPYVFFVKKETEEDDNSMYDIRGLMVDNFLLSMKKMNTTPEFLELSQGNLLQTDIEGDSNLWPYSNDVIIGFIPLIPMVVSGVSEPSIPYHFETAKLFVPCPKPFSRVERILTVFDASVWLTMVIVFVLTSALFWFSVNYLDRVVEIDSKNLGTISKCMYNAWSVFIGVSVPEMPRSWKLRIFFLIYVWYCYAISTVFQAFFISYLVEPGYGKKILTFQELLDTNLTYGFHGVAEFFMATMEFSDHLQFPLSRRMNCPDQNHCLRRVMTDGDIATFAAVEQAQYAFLEYGYNGEMSSPCSLAEDFISGSLVALFSKGNPLLDQFNKNIRQCLEGGLGLRYWAQLKHETILRGRTKFDEVGSSMYFVFNLSHMGPAFCVLGFGYLCSTIVCIAECVHKRFTK